MCIAGGILDINIDDLRLLDKDSSKKIGEEVNAAKRRITDYIGGTLP